MVATHVKNETANVKSFAGIETLPGVAVPPTFVLPGELEINRESALNRQPENTGGYDRNVNARRSPSTFTGSYSQGLTFEDLPQHMRLLLRAGGSGESVSGSSGSAYRHRKAPSFDQDDIDSATIQYGVPGMAFHSTGVRYDSATITIDADASEGSWQLGSSLFVRDKRPLSGSFDGETTSGGGGGGSSSTLTMEGADWEDDEWVGAWVFVNPDTPVAQVRQVESNDEDSLTVSTPFSSSVSSGTPFHLSGLFEAGVPMALNEIIPSYGTRFYLDPVGELGETQVLGRLISASVEVNNNLSNKRFLEHGIDEVSERVGRGDREISGSFQLEFDQWFEYNRWSNTQDVAIRIEQTGSHLGGGTRKRARIDLPRVEFDTFSQDTRENNITATFSFAAYVTPDDPIITVDTINGLSQLGQED